MDWLNKLELVEWLYPRRCPVCDKPVPQRSMICQKCYSQLRYLDGALCYKCGKKLQSEELEYCHDCRERKHWYEQGRALYEYGTIKDAIYRLKYQGRAEYATFFGHEMATRLRTDICRWKPDAIISVPLHPKKMAKRGYNQAELLGRELGKALNVPFYGNLIKRVRNTKPMKDLDPSERQINLKNAFIMRKSDVKLKRVIVIDDIYTTGSTIDSIALCLQKNGIHNIYFITLAIGVGL